MRLTEKQLISALSRYIVNNFPMTEINRLITSRISKLIYVPSVINRFVLGHGVIYFIMQSLLENKPAKTQLSAREAAVRHFIFVNSRSNYYACKILQSLHYVDTFCC